MGHGQQVDRLVVLAVLHEELSTLREHLRIAVRRQVVCNPPQSVEELRGKTQVKGALLVASFLVQDDRLGRLPPLLVILRSLRHAEWVRRQRQAHEVAVEVVLLRQPQCMGHAACQLEVMDGVLDAPLGLQVPCQVVARSLVLRVLAYLLRLVEVFVEASNSAQAQPVAGFPILPRSTIQVRFRLQVLCVPPVQLGVVAPLDICFEVVRQA
mmetsp:Transcript_81902/g.236804  ORF Transcript_81902/g.236804 Transcript_81902/m.236804 type:complete len:211 (+) Transcript_81902:1069-1701(+)